jgi:hypothetical protein
VGDGLANPYTPPTGDLAPVIDLIPPEDRFQVASDKGQIEVARSGERVLLKHGAVTREFPAAKWAANVQMLPWAAKRVVFKPLRLNVAVSDQVFAGLLAFCGLERFMASDLRQLRMVNLLLGVILLALGLFTLTQEKLGGDWLLISVGVLMLLLFALSFTRRYLLAYFAHGLTNACFFLLLSWNLYLGRSGWWVAIFIFFTAIACWSNFAKFFYFRRGNGVAHG